MSGAPKVSVLIASRDGARYLGEALASLARQTFPDLEVVAVDDASTDATAEILRRFAAARPRVRVLRAGGVGLAAALNLAAAEARGALLARHDDDDISTPDRIERQVGYLDRHPEVAALGTWADVIGPAGERLGEYPLPVGPAACRRALRRGPPFVHGSVMMRADAFRAAGGYRPAFRAAQDYDLWLRLPERAGLANLPRPLYRWRRHPGGVFERARMDQLRFAALARTLADERRERGHAGEAARAAGRIDAGAPDPAAAPVADSLAVFEALGGDFERFAAEAPPGPRFAAELGERCVRDGRVREARRWLARAGGDAAAAPRALAWWALSWPMGLTPRARRAEPAGGAP